MQHILRMLVLVLLLAPLYVRAQQVVTKPFFPSPITTVEEAVALIESSRTPEMKLFRNMLIEMFSHPHMVDEEFTETTLVEYLRKHLTAAPTHQVIYGTALPVNGETVIVLGRFPRKDEVIFCLPIVGGCESIFLGSDGALVVQTLGRK